MFQQRKPLFKILAFAFVVTGLSACGYGYPVQKSKPQLVAEPDTATLMLAEAAQKASSALETLASVEQYRTPQASVSTIPNAPLELRRAMSVEWVGPPAPLLSEIARRSGYRFNQLGDVPPNVPVIAIYAQNKQIIDVLRDAGLQLGRRADVRVNAQDRIIELQYSATVGMGN